MSRYAKHILTPAAGELVIDRAFAMIVLSFSSSFCSAGVPISWTYGQLVLVRMPVWKLAHRFLGLSIGTLPFPFPFLALPFPPFSCPPLAGAAFPPPVAELSAPLGGGGAVAGAAGVESLPFIGGS